MFLFAKLNLKINFSFFPGSSLMPTRCDSLLLESRDAILWRVSLTSTFSSDLTLLLLRSESASASASASESEDQQAYSYVGFWLMIEVGFVKIVTLFVSGSTTFS
jgi:hypothetical protein